MGSATLLHVKGSLTFIFSWCFVRFTLNEGPLLDLPEVVEGFVFSSLLEVKDPQLIFTRIIVRLSYTSLYLS